MLDALHQFHTQKLRRLPEEPGPNPIRGIRFKKGRFATGAHFELPHQHVQTGFRSLRKCKRLSNTRTPSNTLPAAREQRAPPERDTSHVPGRGQNPPAIRRAPAFLPREIHAPELPQTGGRATLPSPAGGKNSSHFPKQRRPATLSPPQRRSFDPVPEELPARTWIATYS